MAFTEFFNKEAQKEVQKEAYWQNMAKLGQTRHKFLEMLVEDGVESTHGLGEVLFGDAKGRRMTTVKLVAAGDWAGKNNIQVEIFAKVSKNKLQQLQQANKKPTVQVELTFNNEVVGYSIPNNVTSSYAYKRTRTEYGDEERVGDESYCVGLAEVVEHFQAGKLTVARE